MLYFHPWEFDAELARLPLSRFSAVRTYIGISRTRRRLQALFGRHRFVRAIDAVRQLHRYDAQLPCYSLASNDLAGSQIVQPGAPNPH
jgi:hypothetical protein